MRISAEQRQRNESRIRVVMDQLLGGEIPPGGKSTSRPRPRSGRGPCRLLRHPALRPSLPRVRGRLQARQQAGDLPDRRDAQIARLKDEIITLRQRLADRDHTITSLRDFKNRALAQLASQHNEINRLRTQNEQAAKVRQLSAPTSGAGPYR